MAKKQKKTKTRTDASPGLVSGQSSARGEAERVESSLAIVQDALYTEMRLEKLRGHYSTLESTYHDLQSNLSDKHTQELENLLQWADYLYEPIRLHLGLDAVPHELEFSDFQSQAPFLRVIAVEVELLLIDVDNRKTFESHAKEWHLEYLEYRRSISQWSQRTDQYRKESVANERLRDKAAGPVGDKTVWYDYSPLNRGNPEKGFWGPPCKPVAIDPDEFLVASKGREPENEQQALKRYYILLIILHDWLLPTVPSIDKYNPPLKTFKYIIDLTLRNEGQGLIQISLGSVQADLAPSESPPAANPEPPKKPKAKAKANKDTPPPPGPPVGGSRNYLNVAKKYSATRSTTI